MFIKIDHVAASSNDLREHIKFMDLIGYKPIFIEEKIENPRIKYDLMKKFYNLHDLALLASNGNTSIELINHGPIRNDSGNDGYITPIFENIPDDLIEMNDYFNKEFNIFSKAKIKGLGALIYVLNDRKYHNLKFNKLIIKTRDIKKSTIFWEFFGFKFIRTEEGFSIMEFKSLFNDSCYIYLKKEKDAKNLHFLDDIGFNCIAFISNSVHIERENLINTGIETTEVETIKLNERILSIFFARGNQGELVEIIGIGRE